MIKVVDEYEIKSVLEKFNIDDNKIVEALGEHLDKRITIYLRDEEGIKKSAFTEMISYLYSAMMDAEKDGVELEDRIIKVIDSFKIKKG